MSKGKTGTSGGTRRKALKEKPPVLESLGEVLKDPDLFPLATKTGMGVFPHWRKVTHNTGADYVVGELCRSNPIPAIHHVFDDILLWSGMEDKKAETGSQRSNLLYVQSHPGMGKTVLPLVIAKTFGYKPVFIGSGSGGGDLDQLVVTETFENDKGSGDIIEKLNMLLADERKGPTLAQELRHIKGANDEPNGVYDPERNCINVSALGFMDRDKKGGEIEVSHDVRRKDFKERMSSLYEVLGHYEPQKGASLLGVHQKNGVLLNALLEAKAEANAARKAGRPRKKVMVVLDEFNRYHHFGSRLQNFWELVGGAMRPGDHVEIQGVNGDKHRFTYDDLKHVMFVLTGNDPEREPEARELPPALLSRVKTFNTKEPDAADWQHRLEQRIAGLPINTMYEATKETYGVNEQTREEFGQLLMKRLMQGLSAEEQTRTPPDFVKRLEQWQRTHAATTHLAKFFVSWDAAQRSSDDPYVTTHRTSMPEISLRLINKLVASAYEPPKGGASVTASRDAVLRGDFSAPVTTAANFGTRLIQEIEHLIDTSYASAPQMREAAYRLMFEHRLINLEQLKAHGYQPAGNEQIAGVENARTQIVPELLNCGQISRDKAVLEPLQKLMLDTLRAKYPGVEISDGAVSIHMVDKALDQLLEQEKKLRVDLDAQQSGLPPAIRQLITVDAVRNDAQQGKDAGKVWLEVKPTTLVESSGLLVDERNLRTSKAVLTDLMTANDTVAQLQALTTQDVLNRNAVRAHMDIDVVGHQILTGTDPSRLSYTQVETRYAPKGQTEATAHDYLQVFNVFNPNKGDASKLENTTLIVGQAALDEGQKKLLAEKGITYVCIHDDKAAETAKDTLAAVVAKARQNLQKVTVGDEVKDLREDSKYKETQSKGLVAGLVMAMITRNTEAGFHNVPRSSAPDAQKPEHERMSEARIANIAQGICNEKYYEKDNGAMRASQQAVGMSWADFAKQVPAAADVGKA